MGRIDEQTEQRIKDAADIVSIVGEFVTLRKSGKDYMGLCPFHDDRHVGSFVVSPGRGIYSCFACGAKGDSIKFLMDHQGMKYADALRWIAAKHGIYVDDEPLTYTPTTTSAPRDAAVYDELPVITFDPSIVKAKMAQDGNRLIGWLRGLQWSADERDMLDYVLKLYLVGTSNKGATEGWTIWWYVDDEHKVRTGKMMKYKSDGHRDKTKKADGKEGYNTDWIHSKMEKAGKWSSSTHRYETCLFGLHLVDCFPSAEVCIVESEKSAVMAQTISDPSEKLFMATGSKGALTRRMLQPLIDRYRWIVLYPDVDGIDEWKERADKIGYDRLMVTDRVQRLYDPTKDGPKSDIADIIDRMRSGKEESESERVHRHLGLKEHNEALTELIEQLDLKLL